MLKYFVVILFIITQQNLFSRSDSLCIQDLSDKIAEKSSVIGLGESTHGTKEFTEIRFKIVRNLVLKSDYRVLILEADFYPCQLINKYLTSGEGVPIELLKQIKLWPWINQSFLDFIKWLRIFNLKHPENPVLFYGIDSQLANKFQINESLIKDESLIIELKSTLNSKKKPKKIVSSLYKLCKETEDLFSKYIVLSKIDSISKSGSYNNTNLRDQNMFVMFQSIRDNFLNKKIIIWAHNAHLMKKKPKYTYYKPLGEYLYDYYKADYTAVGFDFCSGTFKASNLQKKSNADLEVFEINPIEDHICWSINNEGCKLILCDTLSDRIYINHIGAGYLNNPTKKMRFYTELKGKRELDYLFVTEKSTPTAKL